MRSLLAPQHHFRSRTTPVVLLACTLAAGVAAVGPARAGAQTLQLTADDYARAERFLTANTSALVHGATVRPEWLGDGRFWYRNTIAGGTEFVVVDPVSATKGQAFDHERLAAAITAATDSAVEPLALPIGSMEFEGHGVLLDVNGVGLLRCDLTEYACERETPALSPVQSNEIVSPDGRRTVFIRDHNLWTRDRESGAETQLTTDGVEDFGYGTNNAGWVRRDRPVVKWSPDSRKIATFQHDARGVGMMYLTSTKVGHPELDAWRYPLPEDTVIFRIQRVVLDLDRPGRDHVRVSTWSRTSTAPPAATTSSAAAAFGDVEWASDAGASPSSRRPATTRAPG